MSAVSRGERRAAIAVSLLCAVALGCEFSSATGAGVTGSVGDGEGASTSTGPPALVDTSTGSETIVTTTGVAADTTLGVADATEAGSSSSASGSTTDAAEDSSSSTTGVTVVTSLYCDSPNVAIPDNDAGGVATPIVVPDAAVVLAVRVQLGITHTHVGDLRLDLRHGEADRLLVSYPGGGACSGDDILARLTDDAKAPVQTACTGDTPALAGDLLPEFSLDAFVGLPMLGAWELRATDGGPADTGTIHAWCIEIDHLSG